MARTLSHVLGHKNQIEKLLEAYSKQCLAQTFLFIGPSGVGKKMTALGITQALLCETDQRACGLCPSCLRVEKMQHESLMIVEPEKNQIHIEKARQILDFLSFKSLTPNRVIILDRVECLNLQAANCLLKILEEPSPGTYFFMTAPSSAHVISTIRSRSQIIGFRPVPLEDMKKKSHAPDWALRASFGSFERLNEFSDKSELEARSEAKNILQSSLKNSLGYLQPEIRDSFRERSNALSLARHLSLLLRDSVYWQAGEAEGLLNPDETNLFAELANRPREKLLRAAQKSLELEKDLLQNRDSQLLFEHFWIENLC